MGVKTNIRMGSNLSFVIDTNKEKPSRFLKRGDIVNVDFGRNLGTEKNGIRPAIIISNNSINKHSKNIIVAPMTSISNKYDSNGDLKLLATHVILSRRFYKNLAHTSIVQLEDMRSVDKDRVTSYVGDVSDVTMGEIERAFMIAVGIQV